VADRRFEVAFESYGAGEGGPDLSATFRKNQRFNLEVTRLRTTRGVDAARVASTIAAKVRQLPGDVPNALVIVAKTLDAELSEAFRLLKQRAEAKDDAFFAARGLKDARDFYTHFLRLGGVLAVDESSAPPRIAWVRNREARRPLPEEAIHRLSSGSSRSMMHT
jgi:hypothetical protein